MPDEFDEALYLRLHPDVAASVARGEFPNGRAHFELHGVKEKRPILDEAAIKRDQFYVTATPSTSYLAGSFPAHHLEAVIASKSGGLFLIGWVDDASDPCDYIRLVTNFWHVTLDGSGLARTRRGDVETALGRDVQHPYGFWSFFFTGHPIHLVAEVTVVIRLKSGAHREITLPLRQSDDIELRNTVLSYLCNASFFGNRQVDALLSIEQAVGSQIVAFNKHISREITANPYVERFGDAPRKIRGSIIVCLYGKAEYLFLQNALFSSLPGIEDYEFIYVSNSPEISERILKDARIGSALYGLRQTLVILPGNAGFGAANNIAARYASSDRVLIVNPDVFPYDRDWAAKHSEAIETRPYTETALFGVPLFYNDGSLMHAGMHFEVDRGISVSSGTIVERDFVRVEHYGKGAPADSPALLASRPVPAVTGAFISVDRAWYEKLGGFTEDYVFGHYEDADFCLKSLQAGIAPWLHDLRLWHLEGKGSTRLPVHEGGSIVNRWVFSHQWGQLVGSDLLGQAPRHPLFSKAPATITNLRVAQS